MSDEALDFSDVLEGPQDNPNELSDQRLLLSCLNLEVSRFCNFYGVNIYTFMDLAYYESGH